MNPQQRITPENITDIQQHEVFVFGSNKSGIHGKGAAKTAMKWGAVYGKGHGMMGQTYGIPTVDFGIRKSLSVEEIKPYVDDFLEYAKSRQDLTFLVTAIGTGLAGIQAKDIAPLFAQAVDIPNICLPQDFWWWIEPIVIGTVIEFTEDYGWEIKGVQAEVTNCEKGQVYLGYLTIPQQGYWKNIRSGRYKIISVPEN